MPNRFHLRRLVSIFCAVIFALILSPDSLRAALWCTAYFPGYNDGNTMTPAEIDFSVVTHVVHFSVIPYSDGSLDSTDNSITMSASTNIIALAHAAGRKALICVGGAGSYNFPSACTGTNLNYFVGNLTNFLATRGYDGIDIDWEPYDDSNASLFTNLVVTLRAAMNHINTHLLLTTALTLPNPWNSTTLPATLASVSAQFDQINLQTYDLSGPYPGWITWHNSAIYDNGQTLPGNLQVPSVNGAILRFITNGIPAAKLGLGVTFHGQLWTGEYYPTEPLTSSPTMTAISYNDITATYSTSPYLWDGGAQAPYISITNANANNAIFISYDDARACGSKVSYARNMGLGGMIVWELKQDHHTGQTDPLLNAIKVAIATPGNISTTTSGHTLNLRFNAAPLGSYAVQWTTNLASTNWTTLVSTNITNVGGTVTITDTIPSGKTNRFYRVKTPQ